MTSISHSHSQSKESGEITFYAKGADTVMSSIVQYSDWLEEEVCIIMMSQRYEIQDIPVWMIGS